MSGLQGTIDKFNKTASDNQRKLERNPFSDQFDKNADLRPIDRYGRPEAGSLTEKRGIKAGNHIGSEIVDLCEWIDVCGEIEADGVTKSVRFGFLFKMYLKVSDKLVGMLLRARKHGLVAFDGEMLYQRQDDEKLITLLRPLADIKAAVRNTNDPQHCLSFAAPASATTGETQTAGTSQNGGKGK